VYFDTTFEFAFPEVALNEIQYLDDESAVIVFTVDVDTAASQTPRVLASAQFAGRLVCSQAVWQVALADVCAILADGTGPPCPRKVKKKAKAALTPALEKAELPEASAPTVETAPTTTTPPFTFTPAPAPPPFDGVCPYVGQPCSANVTNDPDCTCEPVGVRGGFSKAFGVIACRTSEPAFPPDR